MLQYLPFSEVFPVLDLTIFPDSLFGASDPFPDNAFEDLDFLFGLFAVFEDSLVVLDVIDPDLIVFDSDFDPFVDSGGDTVGS